VINKLFESPPNIPSGEPIERVVCSFQELTMEKIEKKMNFTFVIRLLLIELFSANS